MKFDVKVPILGFETIQELELSKIDENFMKLESNSNDISFTLINPFVLREYDFEVPTAAQILLDLQKESNILIFNIVVIQRPIENSRVNFLAPLVFNVDNQRMAQIILDTKKYPQYELAEEIKKYMK